MTLHTGQAVVNRSVEYQTMIGFGGAVTDAAGLNVFALSSETRNKLLEAYFSPAGKRF